jgi:hypothetical protein
MPAKKKSAKKKVKPSSADEQNFTVRGFRISEEAHLRLYKHAKKESARLGLPVSKTKALERLLLRILTEDGDLRMPTEGLLSE